MAVQADELMRNATADPPSRARTTHQLRSTLAGGLAGLAGGLAGLAGVLLAGLVACQGRDVDVSEVGVKGQDCNPGREPGEDPEGRPCADELTCEPIAGADTYVCAAPVRIRGQ